MWWIILYLVGVAVSWFTMAYINDKSTSEAIPSWYVLISWGFIILCFGIIVWDFFEQLSESGGFFSKLCNPSLKYFKKDDANRER